jgi:DNA-directed RNA polymerase subunit L
MKISNIVYKTDDIKYKSSQFAKLIEANINLLPSLLHKRLSFNLTESNEAFANSIRRLLTNELEIKCFHINAVDVVSDDKYLLNDIIKDRIELLPIVQDVDDKLTISKKISNKTTDIINIMSHDIIPQNSKKICNNMLICQLNPGKYLNLTNITIKRNRGIDDGKFSLCSVHYDEINIDKDNILTLNHDSTDFTLSIKTNGNIEFKQMLDMLVYNIEYRLTIIKNNILNYDNSIKHVVLDDEFYIFKEYDITKYHINSEFHTVGNLLTKYIYLLEPHIDLVNYNIIHILKNKIILNVKHPNPNDIVTKAIDNIINDFKLFRKSFD